jgi:hypothetical protein
LLSGRSSAFANFVQNAIAGLFEGQRH